MIGFVVVTHGRLGAELINTAEFILGRIENCTAVSINGQDSPEQIRDRIQEAIKKSNEHGNGVLVLTDMFGGTPSNLSLAFLEPGQVEVLTGVNLPMIIKIAQSRDKQSLAELAQSVGAYGRKSISVAGEILNKKPKP
jgi:PTS system mannose-specific IIA component